MRQNNCIWEQIGQLEEAAPPPRHRCWHHRATTTQGHRKAWVLAVPTACSTRLQLGSRTDLCWKHGSRTWSNLLLEHLFCQLDSYKNSKRGKKQNLHCKKKKSFGIKTTGLRHYWQQERNSWKAKSGRRDDTYQDWKAHQFHPGCCWAKLITERGKSEVCPYTLPVTWRSAAGRLSPLIHHFLAKCSGCPINPGIRKKRPPNFLGTGVI